jgi:hypothetical protein
MEQVKVYYDRAGRTLTVWFGNPEEEWISEEADEEIVLMKNKQGLVIGFEKLDFKIPDSESLAVVSSEIGA